MSRHYPRFSMPRSFFPFTFIGLILLQGLFVDRYVAREHTIYFWDHAMYHAMARSLMATFQSSWSEGLAVLQGSMAQDYNYLFTLPSLLSFSVFGDSRLVFIMTNFIVFFVPFEFAAAFVVRRVYGLPVSTAVLLALGLCSLIPPLWQPLLEGYPDIGSAACVALAVGLNVRGMETWRVAIITGLLLGLAILLRRHFIYAATPFYAVILVTGLYHVLTRVQRHQRLSWLVRFLLLCGVSGLIMLALIGFAAPAFMIKALTIDYSALYFSYKRPYGYFLIFVLHCFGLLLLSASFCGFVLAMIKRPAARKPLVFLVSVFFLWLFVWSMGPSQAGHHYLLHILPLFIIVGVTGFLLVPKRRFLIGGFATLLLSANSAWALWFAPSSVPSNTLGTPQLWSAPRPPAVRKDYDELMRLASYLASTTTIDDNIFVLGSSFVFNQDLVRAVYTDVLHLTDPLFRFLPGPEIDSNQRSFLDPFASATTYVVPEPAQYHLDPSQQKVITATSSQFPPPPLHQPFFQKDNETFHLENGVTVSVWRRKPWFPGILHAALKNVRNNGPSSNQFWVALSSPRSFMIGPDVNGRTDIAAAFVKPLSYLDLFYDHPLPAGRYRLTATLVQLKGCQLPSFAFIAQTEQGQTAAEGSFLPSLEPAPVYWIFSLSQEASFVRLHFQAIPLPVCELLLQGLQIELL